MPPIVRAVALAVLALPTLARSGAPGLETTRWINVGRYPNLQDLGVPKSVALGDDGALVVIGRTGTRPGVHLHAAGSETPVHALMFDQPTYYVDAAAADHAPTAAAMALVTPGDGVWESRIHFFDTAGPVEERWTWTFPQESSWTLYGAGVEISDDGQVIFAWQYSFALDGYRMVALDPDGNVLSQFDMAGQGWGYHAKHRVRLSDDGTRAIVPRHAQAVLVDVLNGTTIDVHTASGASGGEWIRSVTLSGDGTRYAMASAEELSVRAQDEWGFWQDVLVLSHDDDARRYGPLDLSRDGARLAYTLQHVSPSDAFELALMEPDTGAELARVVQSAPGTWQALRAFDVDLADDGRTIAVASLGDSDKVTPEAFVIDEEGALLAEYHLDGSAVDVDLDARAEVLVVGAEDGHGYHNIGGYVVLADVRAPGLRLMGIPRAGEDLELTLAGDAGHSIGVLWAAPALGTSQTPWGGSTLDFGAGATRVGTWALSDGAARDLITIGAELGLAGELLHFQGATLGGAPGALTNKVSTRILP